MRAMGNIDELLSRPDFQGIDILWPTAQNRLLAIFDGRSFFGMLPVRVDHIARAIRECRIVARCVVCGEERVYSWRCLTNRHEKSVCFSVACGGAARYPTRFGRACEVGRTTEDLAFDFRPWKKLRTVPDDLARMPAPVPAVLEWSIAGRI